MQPVRVVEEMKRIELQFPHQKEKENEKKEDSLQLQLQDAV